MKRVLLCGLAMALGVLPAAAFGRRCKPAAAPTPVQWVPPTVVRFAPVQQVPIFHAGPGTPAYQPAPVVRQTSYAGVSVPVDQTPYQPIRLDAPLPVAPRCDERGCR